MESLQSCLKFYLVQESVSTSPMRGEFHDFSVHAVLKKDHCSEMELPENQ